MIALSLALAASSSRADVYHMTDGDRITGKTLSQAQGFYKVDTVYGRVSIPKGRIAKIVHDDGREEILDAAAARPERVEPPPATPVALVLVISGATFWQAWSGKDGTPVDPSLRLELSLEEKPVAAYTDSKIDPELPGATANSFSFSAADVTLAGADGVTVQPPETRPGRITLKIDLPSAMSGEKRLRFAYQTNEGSPESPAWRDLVDTLIHVELKPDAPNIVEIRQDRGRMEFSGLGRKKMKNVESFRIEAKAI